MHTHGDKCDERKERDDRIGVSSEDTTSARDG